MVATKLSILWVVAVIGMSGALERLYDKDISRSVGLGDGGART